MADDRSARRAGEPDLAPADAAPSPGSGSLESSPGGAGDARWRPAMVGDGIVRVDVWATVVFAVSSVAAAVWPGALAAALVVDLGLFVVGSAVFAWAYLQAVGRSRNETIPLGGLFFLAGDVAPRDVKRWLWGAFAVQAVVAVGTAAARPFSGLAFGVLAPMFGMAMLALWGARHGRFPAR